jgi:RNA polymerase sigma-70 factor, ECF subfamily
MPKKALFRTDELAPLAAYLQRFAFMKLRDDDLAREAVQETFLAALENRSSFAGKSTLKTWLTAILKFKIIDLIRRQAREPAFSSLIDSDAEDIEALLEDETSPFTQAAPVWERPEAAFEEKEFWRVFEAGLATLPGKTQRVFVMRDVLGHSTEEICKELTITETNCWVILHRARLGMRQYLSENWFNTTELEYRDAAEGLLGDLPAAVDGARSRTYPRGNRSTETALRAL